MANVGIILPPFIIMPIITKTFIKFKHNKCVQNAFSGILPVTVGLIASSAVLVSYDSFKSILICVCVFIAAYKYEIDPIILTIISGLIGFVLYK